MADAQDVDWMLTLVGLGVALGSVVGLISKLRGGGFWGWFICGCFTPLLCCIAIMAVVAIVRGLLEDPSVLAEVVIPAVIPEGPGHKANDQPGQTGELANQWRANATPNA